MSAVLTAFVSIATVGAFLDSCAGCARRHTVAFVDASPSLAKPRPAPAVDRIQWFPPPITESLRRAERLPLLERYLQPQASHTIAFHTIPCHTIPYHTIPYHTIPYQTVHLVQQHRWRHVCCTKVLAVCNVPGIITRYCNLQLL